MVWLVYEAIVNGDDGSPKFGKKKKKFDDEEVSIKRELRYKKGDRFIIGDAIQSGCVILIGKNKLQTKVFGNQFAQDFKVTGVLKQPEDLIEWFE